MIDDPFLSGWECLVCGAKTPGYLGLATRLGTRIGHAITRLTRWHRQALAVWRIEHGRDPITGKHDPALVYSPWAQPDADIIGDLQRFAQRARQPESFPGQQMAGPPPGLIPDHSTPEAVRQDAERVLTRVTGKHSTSQQDRLDFLGLSGDYAKPTPLPTGDRPSRYPLIPVWVDLMGEMTPEEHAAAEAYEREQADLARRQRRERAVQRLQLPLVVVAGLCAIGIIVWTALT